MPLASNQRQSWWTQPEIGSGEKNKRKGRSLVACRASMKLLMVIIEAIWEFSRRRYGFSNQLRVENFDEDEKHKRHMRFFIEIVN
ncbi:unnamed protein product [Linum trigynum]|uniref:Uncharacterized protein n=1 Tax=Linum trigynum TaxID=586398 RepID=A0AAV2G7I8_9ROSI